jgi:hypothetical protein
MSFSASAWNQSREAASADKQQRTANFRRAGGRLTFRAAAEGGRREQPPLGSDLARIQRKQTSGERHVHKVVSVRAGSLQADRGPRGLHRRAPARVRQ